MYRPGKYYTCHQPLVEELATASISNNIPWTKSVSAIIFNTSKHHPTRREFTFTTVFMKQDLS